MSIQNDSNGTFTTPGALLAVVLTTKRAGQMRSVLSTLCLPFIFTLAATRAHEKSILFFIVVPS
jgi:hypothetical protein